MPSLQGKKVAVLFTEGVEESELTQPTEALREAGAQVDFFAPKEGSVQAFRHHDKGGTYRARSLEEARAADYDAAFLPGGALNADVLRMNPVARSFVQAIDKAGKPIAAICHAPWLLVSSGLVRGRALTSYFTLQDDVRNAGGTWVDEAVVRDGRWVTSRQPKDIPAFNAALIDLVAAAPAPVQPTARESAPSTR